MLTLGIDDAGRGPLIGPMILAGALLTKEQEKYLTKFKVRDSKTVLALERTKLAKIIKETAESFHIVKVFPQEIDFAINNGTNLNTLEAMKTAEIINQINSGKFRKEKIKVIVDCPSVNITAWQNTLLSYVEHKENLDVHCEHKADANHVSAAAGSLLAKFTREEEVDKLKKLHGPIGSGYPSDPVTKIFLKEKGSQLKDSGIFRKTWATWKVLYPENNQKTLGDF